MQSPHNVVGYGLGLVEASLLAYPWVHPGDPVYSAATYGCGTLTIGARCRQMGETRWVTIKRHTAHVLTYAPLAHMGVSISL